MGIVFIQDRRWTLALASSVLAGCAARPDPALTVDMGLLEGDAGRIGEAADVRAVAPAPRPALDGAERVDMALLLQVADGRNPRIAAARAEVGVAAGQRWQAGLYPNPSLEIGAEDLQPYAAGFSTSQTTIGVSQPIVMGDRLEAATAAWSAEQRARVHDLDETRREVFGDVRREAARIAHLQRSIALHEQLLELAGQTLSIAETRFEARAAPESEVIRARIEAETLEFTKRRLGHELTAAVQRLESLLGGTPVPLARLDLDETAPARLAGRDELAARVRETHPALRAAALRVEAAERRVEEARAVVTSDIEVSLAYGYDNDADEHVVEGGVSVPLSVFDKNEGAILASRYGVIAAQARVRATEERVLAELATALESYHGAREEAEALGRIVGEAERALAQTRDGYQAGKLDFLDLLDAQRTLTESGLTELDVRRDLRFALADLYTIVGAALPAEHFPEGERNDS